MSNCFKCIHFTYEFKKTGGPLLIEISKCELNDIGFKIARCGGFYPSDCSKYEVDLEKIKDVNEGCEFCEGSSTNLPCYNCGLN